jgi:hypothetical protein
MIIFALKFPCHDQGYVEVTLYFTDGIFAWLKTVGPSPPAAGGESRSQLVLPQAGVTYPFLKHKHFCILCPTLAMPPSPSGGAFSISLTEGACA